MRKKPEWGEPMPYRVFDFTPEQEALIREIEDKTSAEVIVIAPYRPPSCGGRDSYTGFLSRPEEYLHELESEDLSDCYRLNPPWAEENGKVSYIADHPKTGRMSEAELRKYPENIRGALEHYGESCNIVDECIGDDIDQVLQEMQALTVLLEMGWHLGRERDFDDPFLYEEEPMSAEEEIWWEHDKFRWFLETGSKLEDDDETDE